MSDIVKNIKPTESELDILKILWANKKSTVREVHEILALNKDVGYTTTLKLMQIMHEKGIVERDDSSKVHIYTPAINQENIQQKFLGKMIDTLFCGNSSQLVLQALGTHDHTTQELDAIQQLLNTLKNK